MNYGVLVIDPPWDYHAGGAKAARPRRYDKEWGFRTMPTTKIFDLLDKEVFPLAGVPHCVFLWCLERSLLEGEQSMADRGYKRHCRFVWDKRSGHAPAFTIRYTHEFLVWYYSPTLPPVSKDVRGKFSTVFQAKPRVHGQKPDVAYEMISALYPDAQKLDVFSREDRAGFDSWGDEVGKLNKTSRSLFHV